MNATHHPHVEPPPLPKPQRPQVYANNSGWILACSVTLWCLAVLLIVL